MRIISIGQLTICLIVLSFLFHGCSTLSNQYEKDEYERTMFDYDTAMQLSEFNVVCKFLDSAVMERDACLAHYDNLKIIEYEVLEVEVVEEKKKVTQSVVVDYHFRDQVVLKKVQYEQTWKYQEDVKTWLLQSEPPMFE